VKKLTLNKETVRCLQDLELRNVNGGGGILGGVKVQQPVDSDITCGSCFPTDCTCVPTDCICNSYGMHQACPW